MKIFITMLFFVLTTLTISWGTEVKVEKNLSLGIVYSSFKMSDGLGQLFATSDEILLFADLKIVRGWSIKDYQNLGYKITQTVNSYLTIGSYYYPITYNLSLDVTKNIFLFEKSLIEEGQFHPFVSAGLNMTFVKYQIANSLTYSETTESEFIVGFAMGAGFDYAINENCTFVINILNTNAPISSTGWYFFKPNTGIPISITDIGDFSFSAGLGYKF